MNEQEVRERLAHLKTLEKNWDSYGCDPISTKSFVGIEPLIALDPYFVCPAADGSLGIEWRHPTWSLEVSVELDGSYGYLFVPRKDGKDVKDGWIEKDDVSLEELLIVIKEGIQ